jgi:CRISPR-associated protein Cmr5
MNKKRVNEWLLIAKEALEKSEIVENGKINKTYRGQISSFGAAVVMGSLPAAVAFFSEQGGSTVDRTKLLVAMYYCIFQEKKSEKEILDFVVKNDTIEMREKFTDAAIALKLAMNFFELVEKE